MMVIELRSFCTTGGGSSAVTSTKSMFALNRPALPPSNALPGPGGGAQTRSSGNLVTQILFQVRVVNAVAMPCPAMLAFAHIDPELYMICVSWESCDKHAHIVTRP